MHLRAPPTWAPADSAALHPGVQAYTDGAQCTTNFVFTDSAANVYLGYAAHCAGTGAATDTNGCDAGSLPLGTKVEFSEGGSLVSRHLAGNGTGLQLVAGDAEGRHHQHERLRVQRLRLGEGRPGVRRRREPLGPVLGRPEAIESNGTTAGESVHSYGNSSLRGGIEALSPKQGSSLGTTGGGWSHSVYTVTPGVPGDSGSAFLDADGNALGTLSTLAIAPVAGSNGVGDLSRELSFAQANAGISGLQSARGTEPFSPIL